MKVERECWLQQPARGRQEPRDSPVIGFHPNNSPACESYFEPTRLPANCPACHWISSN